MLIDIIIFAAVFSLGFLAGSYSMFNHFSNKEVIGSILIVKQEDHEDGLLLEINKGHTNDIKPGNIIRLAVETASVKE